MSSVKGRAPRRRYESPLREEHARRTRAAIVAAAGELFTARGYAATSLADVAAAAGVARPTVFAAFGSKPALLRQVLDQALAGDDEPVPVAARPWFRPVWDATTQEGVLGAYARVCTLIGGRAAQIFEAVRRSAGASPEVRTRATAARPWHQPRHRPLVGLQRPRPLQRPRAPVRLARAHVHRLALRPDAASPATLARPAAAWHSSRKSSFIVAWLATTSTAPRSPRCQVT
jgi:AcrR family transcriptional regulator